MPKRISILLAATALLGMSLSAFAHPPSWAPAHGHRAKHAYHYLYYPAYPIYYAPDRHLWFWLNDGHWSFGITLPLYLRHHVHSGVSLYYDAPYPYVYHSRTIVRYPPPQHVYHHYYRPPSHHGHHFDRRRPHHDGRHHGRHHGGRRDGRHDRDGHGRGHGRDRD